MAADAKIVLSAEDKTRAAFESVKTSLTGLHTTAVAVTGVLGTLGATAWAGKMALDVKAVIDGWDELGKAAQRAGFQSVQAMGEFQYAAKLAGVDAAGFEGAVGKLSAKMADAAGGSKEAAALFSALGVKVKDAAGNLRSTETVLTDLAGKFASFRDSPAKTALALDLFGKSGKELIPLLNGGAAGVEKLREEFRQLRGVLDDRTTKAAEQFNDNLTKLETAAGGFQRQVASKMLPGLVQITEVMVEQAKKGNALLTVWSGLAEFSNVIVGTKGGFFETKKLADQAGRLQQEKAILDKLEADVNSGRRPDEASRAELGMRRENFERSKRAFRIADWQRTGTGEFAPMDPSYAALEDVRMRPKLKDAPGKKDVTESDYDKINRSIVERLKLSAQELTMGRELSDVEKFEVKILDDLSNSKVKLTDVQREHVVQMLDNVKTQDVLVKSQRAEYEQAMTTAKERQRLNAEGYEQARKLAEEEAGRLDFGKKTLEQIEFETTLIGMNAEERERALITRELETKGIKEGSDAWEKYGRAILDATGNRTRLQQQSDAFRDMWESIDRTAHDVWTNIFEGGTNVFKKLGQTLQAAVLDVLYQMTVKRWVISIGASMGLPGAAQAAQTMGGGASMLGSLGNLGSMLAGGSSMANVAGSAFANITGTGIDGLLATNGAFGTAAGGAGSMFAAAGPWVAAAAAIYALAKALDGGETRSGGQYNFGNLIAGPSGGQLAQGGAAAGATAQGINQLLASVGSSSRLTNFMTGLESSEKGKGFAYAGGTLSTGQAFGQGWGAGFAQDGWMNRRGNMTPEQAVAAFSEELKQATLQALQSAADVPESIARLLRDKDFDAMAADQLDATLTAVQSVITGVNQFATALDQLPFENLRRLTFDLKAAFIDASGGVQQALANLSGYTKNYLSEAEQREVMAANISNVLNAAGGSFTPQQILSSSRGQFRQVVDAFSGRDDVASVRFVAALMSVQEAFASLYPATESVAAALSDATTAQQRYLDSLAGAGEGIAAWLRQMRVTQGGLASPETLLTNTRAQYLSDLGLARQGNLDASGRITSSAQAYIDAQKGYSASGTLTQAVIAQVLSEMEDLPATKTFNQTMIEQGQAQLAQLNTIANNTAATVSAVTTGTAVQQAYFTGLAGVVPGGVATGNTNTGSGDWGGSPTRTTTTASQSYTSWGPGSVVPAFARGGTASGYAWVGEDGPELAFFSQPARIYSAGQSAGMAGEAAAGAQGEVRQLRVDVQRLTQVVAEGLRQEVANTGALVAGSRDMANARLLASVGAQG